MQRPKMKLKIETKIKFKWKVEKTKDLKPYKAFNIYQRKKCYDTTLLHGKGAQPQQHCAARYETLSYQQHLQWELYGNIIK